MSQPTGNSFNETMNVRVLDTTLAAGAATEATLGKVVLALQSHGATSVEGGLTNKELRARPVIVTGPLTNTELRATGVAVTGPLTDAELRAADVGVEQGAPAVQTSAAAWPVRLVGGTGDRAATIDSSTNALIQVDYEHHEVHGGSAFSYYFVQDVTGAAAVHQILIVTPAGTKYTHLRYLYNCEAEFAVELFEGATTSADGAAASSYNRNRNSATAAGTLIYTGPTVTVAGTVIRVSRVGSGGGSGGSGEATSEWVLKPATKYLWRFTKAAAGTAYVSGKLWWYEHTDKTA